MPRSCSRRVYNVNRAIKAVTKALDHFELQCAKNGMIVKRVTFKAEKRGEWSAVRFYMREAR